MTVVTDRPRVIVAIPLQPAHLDALRERYAVHYAPDGLAVSTDWHGPAATARAIVTNGSTGLTGAQLAHLPNLGLVLCFGAGVEHVDFAAARAAGVAVTHAPHVNDATVADHALALLLACARGLVGLDRAVRRGEWRTSREPRPTLNGAVVGIVGLGHIGAKIAVRAAAFDAEVVYHARTRRAAVPWRYAASVHDLARASDYLVLACPGGEGTRHLVDASVFDALGPRGFLVNVARGSVVDTTALVEALERRAIAGAALDVVDGEPEVPAALLACDKVVLTPHVAGRSPAALRAQLEICLENLDAFFAGRPLTGRLV
ncbi:MAG: NAD(P)-dependent oxidoreductase [Vicinamibacterales bacterium]